MKIFVTSGVGTGKTPLSAFDAALKDAGVYNYNLITLSSVIPPQTEIVVEHFDSNANGDEHGHKLYIVKAEKRSREAGEYIGAGLGWYQMPDGRGVFVEHEQIGDTEHIVQSSLEDEIINSLSDLCNGRGYPLEREKMKMHLSIAKVEGAPASVLVIAVYKAEGWE